MIANSNRGKWLLTHYVEGGDFTKIENYDKAMVDKENEWQCHHKLEIQGPFTNSTRLLERCGLYWNVPASQLIFLPAGQHSHIHNSANKDKISKRVKESYDENRLEKYRTRFSSQGNPNFRADLHANLQKMIEMYNNGASLRVIGEKFNTSGTQVMNMLRKAGVKRRPIGTNQFSNLRN